MKKEELIKLGLDETSAQKVADASADELKSYVPYERFKEKVDECNSLKGMMKERDNQLEELKKVGSDADGLKKQIEDLQKENEEKDKRHDAEKKRLRRISLDDQLLREVNAIDPLAVKPFLAAIDESVDDEGYTALRKQQIEALTKAESKQFLFKSAQDQQPQGYVGVKPGENNTAQPPAGGGLANPFAKETYNEPEQLKLFKENPELARTLARQAGVSYL